MKEAREEIDEIRREFGDNIEKLRYNLGAKDQYGLTALHYAVKYNHFEIVKLLVENKIGKWIFFVFYTLYELKISKCLIDS